MQMFKMWKRKKQEIYSLGVKYAKFFIRIVWKILCWWQRIARKHGFEEQVEEIDTLKQKIVDYKIILLEKEGR